MASQGRRQDVVPELTAAQCEALGRYGGLNLITAMLEAIESREPLYRGHFSRVSSYSRIIAQELGFGPDQVRAVEVAGLLHDVGKVGVSDDILRRVNELELHEVQLLMQHAVIGAAIVQRDPALAALAPLIRHHHEWYSGGGVPDGLVGEEIPCGARIISIADAFDLLTSVSPFGGPIPWTDAVARLRDLAGRQFWPAGVEALANRVARDAQEGAAYVRFLDGRIRPIPGVIVPGGPGGWGSPGGPGSAAGPGSAGNQGEAAGPAGSGGGSLAGSSGAVAARELWQAGIGIGPLSPVHTRSLVVLYRVATALGAVLDLREMLNRVIEIIQQDVGYADAALVLLDPHQDQLVVAAGGGSYRSQEGFCFSAQEGLSGQALKRRSVVYAPDVTKEPSYLPGAVRIRAEAAIPLVVDDRPVGVLVIGSPHVAGVRLEDIQVLRMIASELATAIEVARHYQEASTASTVDGLTQLYNHRYFWDRLAQEIARAERYQHPLQVAILDVDDLKAINDQRGHLAGDQALRMIAQTLKVNTRSSDVLARYGGDEFAIIFPETPKDGAWRTLCRIGDALEHGTFEIEGVKARISGVSYGLAGYPEEGRTAKELVALADQRMYVMKQAKEAGRTAAT